MKIRILLFLFGLLFWLVPSISVSQQEEFSKMFSEVKKLKNERKYKEAVPLAEKLLAFSEEKFGKEDTNTASVCTFLGGCYKGLSKYTEAESSFQRALKIREKVFGPEKVKVAISLNDLAVLSFTQGKYAEAESLYLRAYNICEKDLGPEHPDIAKALNNLAVLYNEQGKYKEAEPIYKRVLQITEKALGPEHLDVAQSLNNIAALYNDQGKYAEAEPLYKRALKIREKVLGSEDIDVAQSLNNLAALYNSQGRYVEAKPLYQRTIKICEKVLGPEHPIVAISLNNLAVLAFAQGKYTEAEPLYQKVLKMIEKNSGPDNPDVARSLNNLALLYSAQSKFSEAEPLYQRVVKIMEKALGPEHPDLAKSLSNLASLYIDQGKYEEAEQIYQRTLKVREKILGPKHNDVAQSLNSLALIYCNQYKYQEAESLNQRALKIYEQTLGPEHPEVARSLNSLALLFYAQGKYTEAEPLFKRALKIYEKALGPEHPETARSLHNLASLYCAQNKYTEAEPLYQRSLKIYETALIPKHSKMAQTLTKLALLYLDQGRYGEAEAFFLKADRNYFDQIERYFPSMSESDKTKFYETIKKNIEVFNLFAVKRKEENPSILCNMYDNQLITKALILNSTNKVKNRILNSNDEKLKEKYIEWMDLKTFIAKSAALSKEELKKKKIKLDSLENLANDIEKELNRESEIFAKENDTKVYSWKDVQGKLKENEAAIEIVRFRYYDKKFLDSVCYAFLLVTKETEQHPEIVIIKNGRDLEGPYLKEYLKGVELGEKGSYKRYFKDVLDNKALSKIKKIYVSPDGIYNQINLLTLRKPDGKYLIDEYDIQIVGNTKDLLSFGKSRMRTEDKAELFGYPNYRLNEDKQITLNKRYTRGTDARLYRSSNMAGMVLPELPGTKIEISEIEKILIRKQWKVNSYIEDEALEEAVKAVNNPKVLHIATHGYFHSATDSDRVIEADAKKFYENPLLKTGLFLAGSGETVAGREKKSEAADNGILTAYEAMNLNLDSTDLVVLSACQTGQGVVMNGEGVYGLQRAFQKAGAKSIIMSLWEVSDEATQELMTTFYKKWTEYKDKRKAFKEAQLKIKEKYTDPVYWGAFVLVGE